jgi:hypothetical protein
VVFTGEMQLVSPPHNIYPEVNYNNMHRTYKLSASMTRWRTKLVLDFSYLFSYCEALSTFFVLLEDDIVPEENFVAKTLDFVKDNADKHWISLIVSEFLSIGGNSSNYLAEKQTLRTWVLAELYLRCPRPSICFIHIMRRPLLKDLSRCT